MAYPPGSISTSDPIRAAAYDSESDDDLPTTRKNQGLKPRGSKSFLIPKVDSSNLARSQLSATGLTGFIKLNEGFLLIALSQSFFALINTCVKLLNELDGVSMPTYQIIWIRMAITWIGCYTYMRATGVKDAFFGPKEVRVLLAVRGASGFAGLFGIYFSLQYLSLSDATTLTFCAPMITGILSYFVLKESYSKAEALTGVVSLLGVILVAKPSFIFSDFNKSIEIGPDGSIVTTSQRNIAILVALLGCVGAAGAYISIRKIGKRAHALHVIAFFSLYCVFVSSLYPFFFHAPPVLILTGKFWLLLTSIGVCGFIAQGLLTMGLQRETAGRGSLAIYTNILFTICLEFFVFGKLPDALSALGALIIIAGGVFIALEKGKRSAKLVSLTAEESKLEEGLIE